MASTLSTLVAPNRATNTSVRFCGLQYVLARTKFFVLSSLLTAVICWAVGEDVVPIND